MLKHSFWPGHGSRKEGSSSGPMRDGGAVASTTGANFAPVKWQALEDPINTRCESLCLAIVQFVQGRSSPHLRLAPWRTVRRPKHWRRT
jgi:hypothetical protein